MVNGLHVWLLESMDLTAWTMNIKNVLKTYAYINLAPGSLFLCWHCV